MNVNQDLVRLMAQKMSKSTLPYDNKRGMLTRVFDVLSVGTYLQAGLTRGLIGSNDISIVEGVGGALRAANPFGSGYEKGRHTNSQVLDDMGWQPTSTGGKIARGVVGFLGDVFLDPTTYLTGGASAIVKGKGKAGAMASHKIKAGLTKEAAETIITNRSVARNLGLSADEIAKEAGKLVTEFDKIVGLRGTAKDLRWSLAGAPFGTKIFGQNADKIGFTIAKGEALQALGEKSLAPVYAKARDSVLGGKLGKLFSTRSDLYKLSKTDPSAMYDLFKQVETTRGLTTQFRMLKKGVYEKSKLFENLTPAESKEMLELMADKSKWSRVQKMIKLSDTQEAIVYRNKLEKIYKKTSEQVDNLAEMRKTLLDASSVNQKELGTAQEELANAKEAYQKQLSDLKVNRINDKTKLQEATKMFEDEIARIQKAIEDATPKPVVMDDVVKRLNEYDATLLDMQAYDEKTKKLVEMRKEFKETHKYSEAIPIPDGVLPARHSQTMNQVKKQGYYALRDADAANKFKINYPDWTEVFVDGQYRFSPPSGTVGDYDLARALREQAQKVIMDEAESLKVKPVADRVGVVESISEMLYGKPNVIKPNLNKQQFDKLTELIRKGETPEAIMRHIDANGGYFFEDWNDIFSFVGDHIGYGKNSRDFQSWDALNKEKARQIEAFDAQLNPLRHKKETIQHRYSQDLKELKKKKHLMKEANYNSELEQIKRLWEPQLAEINAKVEPLQILRDKEYGDLAQKTMKRQEMIRRFRGAKTSEEVKSIMKEYNDLREAGTVGATKQTANTTGRAIDDGGLRGFADDDSALFEKNPIFKPNNPERGQKILKQEIKQIEKAISEGVPTRITRDEANSQLARLNSVKKERMGEIAKRKKEIAKTEEALKKAKEIPVPQFTAPTAEQLNKIAKAEKFKSRKINEAMQKLEELRSLNADDMVSVQKMSAEATDLEMFLSTKKRFKDLTPEQITNKAKKLHARLKEKKEALNELTQTADARSEVKHQLHGKDRRAPKEVADQITLDLQNMLIKDNPRIDIKKVSPGHHQFVGRVEEEVHKILKSKDMDFSDFKTLDWNQKQEIYYQAKQDAINRVNKNYKGTFYSDVSKEAKKLEEAKHAKVIHDTKMEVLSGKLQEGFEADYLLDGRLRRGVIKEVRTDANNKVSVLIQQARGEVTEVPISNIKGVKLDANMMTIDDFLTQSRTTHSFVKRFDETSALLDDLNDQLLKAQEGLKKVGVEHKREYNKAYRDFKKKTVDVRTRISELEKQGQAIQEQIAKGGFDNLDEKLASLRKLEDALANDDALETLMRADVNIGDEIVDRITKTNEVAQVLLNSDVEVTDKIRTLSQILRDDLVKMGLEEVRIGKLKFEQLDNFVDSYITHILTEDGGKIFGSAEEIVKKFPSWGDDFGYGMEFNPHAKSRVIKRVPDGLGGYIDNPNVVEINRALQEEFGDILKGKNAFSENIAEIYLARATKHLDLMYDDKYMHNMLNIFGNEYTGAVEGYQSVMNFGKLREVSGNTARLQLSMDISDAVTDHISNKALLAQIDARVVAEVGVAEGYAYKKRFSELMNSVVERFLKENFPSDVRNILYEEKLGDFVMSTELGRTLDDFAVPMVQLNDVQIKGINSAFDSTKMRYFEHIKSKFKGFQRNHYFELYKEEIPTYMLDEIDKLDIGTIKKQLKGMLGHVDEIDAERINRMMGKVDIFENLSDVQVRSVNDAIVQKANQARLIQIAKDQNKFLDMYDKMTHFIKLNQTTVIPGWHAKNKINNTFRSWLEIGSDAVNLEFQKKAWQAAKNKGEVAGALKITNADGTIGSIDWSEIYRLAQEFDVINEGAFASELGVGRVGKGWLGRFNVSGKFDPTDTKNFIGYKKGAQLGGLIENQDRMIHFASQMSRGMSPADAAASAAKHLFDYSDLTMFEQTVMKRIFPYYTWMRKNVPLQLDMMLQYPEKYQYLAKIKLGVEGMVDADDRINREFVNDFAKDWIQTPFFATNPEGRREPVLWNPNLAHQDIGKLPDVTDLGGTARSLFSQANPMLTVPIEQILNRNFFFDSDIVRDGESQLGRRGEHVISNLALYGVGKGFARKRGVDLGLHALNSTSGIKLISYDYDKYKAMKIQELLEKKRSDIRNRW